LPVPDPLLREDHCSCSKEPGTYGLHGRHWRPDPDFPASRQMDRALEPCPAYLAQVQRNSRFDKAAKAGRRPGMDESYE